MTGGRTIGALLTALLVVFAAGTAAQAPDPALAARLERLRALRLERPADGLLAYYQALTHAALGQHDAALAELRALRGRRLGIVPQGGFEAMQGSPDFRAVRAQLAADEPATPEAPVMHTLRDARLVPEGIAYDASRGRYFVGSIAQRKIVAIDGRGRVRDFSRRSDALDAVLGLAVDAARGALWAVSTNGFLDEASRQRRNAVVQYELASGRLVARHEVPEALQLNDVAVAADGTLYATDARCSLPGGRAVAAPGRSSRSGPASSNGAGRGASMHGAALPQPEPW